MFCGGYFLCPTMLSTAHSLLSRAYFEGKMNAKSLNYLYPIEREIYALIEPSQLASTQVPPHLSDLIDKLYSLLDSQCDIYDVFPQYKNVFTLPYSYIQPLEIRGDIPYTIYVDMHNDTHEYIIKRLHYYTGVPNIILLCDGKVTQIEPGQLFSYAIPYASPQSRLSYAIGMEIHSTFIREVARPLLDDTPEPCTPRLAFPLNPLSGTEPPRESQEPPSPTVDSASEAYPIPPPRLNLSGSYRDYLPRNFNIVDSPILPSITGLIARYPSTVVRLQKKRAIEPEIEFAHDEHMINYEELD
jgi:hypothetical protein